MKNLKGVDSRIVHLALNRVFAERCRKSLYYTAKKLCGFKDVNLRTHGGMIRALEDISVRRRLIVVPRGCLKTSISCVAYPIWRLINDPNLRIFIDSELYRNSKNTLREIRAHLESEKAIEAFGKFKSDQWNEGEITICQRTKAYREASITAGGIGTTKVGQHYNIIIADDMNSPQNTNTPDNAQKVIDHFKYNLAILEPDGEYNIIATRYAENDLPGHILSNELGIKDTPVSGTYEAA